MGKPRGAWSDKAWRDAIRLAVNKRDKGGKRLEQLANVLVVSGLAGDVSALKEIGDRLDGKPSQTIEATITDERSVIRAPETSESSDAWQTSHKPH